MTKSKQAVEFFRSGMNCAQSVLLAFADELKLNRQTALRIAAGFGGGMGKLQGTCGAVTGAYMVLGLYRGNAAGDNRKLMEGSYDLVRQYSTQFSKEFGSTSCMDLVRVDMKTPEGNERFKSENIKEEICCRVVERSVEILESLILPAKS